MRPYRSINRALLHHSTAAYSARWQSSSPSGRGSPTRGIRLSAESEGISSGLSGFGVHGGSISAFMKSPAEKEATEIGKKEGERTLLCDLAGSPAALQAAQDAYMLSVSTSGKLPSPREKRAAIGPLPEKPVPPSFPRNGQGSAPSSLPRRKPPPVLHEPLQVQRKTLPATKEKLVAAKISTMEVSAASTSQVASEEDPTSPSSSPPFAKLRMQEAADYYRSLPKNELTKEEMWARINASNADRAEATGTALGVNDVDYLKMEEELRDYDILHYRIGEIAYTDENVRRDYYALWNLAMSLNKARWTMLEVHSQRGVKTTGAGMKLLFWKESINGIMEKSRMAAGQFTDSHPVLRPFAAAVERNPQMTKAFVRGFTDARLRVIQQPGNVQQLFDHFDKFYGYFFNSLLEVTHVKDEAAEHIMMHIGRATGLTNHCVMFWKKYARLGFTMLPADLCADNHVNLALLKNIPLASRDRAVRKLLFDVMSIAKDEMLQAEKIAKNVPEKAWPIVMECMYANYYLGFLQRREFNVSAMFADYNIENAGFAWYRLKKRWEWERHQSIKRLVSEPAPIPVIETSLFHRGSQYKMASGIGQTLPQDRKRPH